jgi:hypothetical protein
MDLEIKYIPVQYVAQTWPMVEKYIKDAQQYDGGDYTVDQIQVYLSTGQWALVVAVDDSNTVHGAMTLSFISYPNDRVAFVTSTGGKMIINKDSLKQLKAIMQQMGATKIQAAVRPSMARLLGRTDFYERYMIVESKI